MPAKSARFSTSRNCSSGRKSCTVKRAPDHRGKREPNCLPARHGFCHAQLYHQISGELDQLARNFDHFGARYGQTHMRRQTCTQHFVRQDAKMLGIILELDDVIAAVIAAHQVRLCAASHPADLLEREDHGPAMLASVTHGRPGLCLRGQSFRSIGMAGGTKLAQRPILAAPENHAGGSHRSGTASEVGQDWISF